jgi:hypothetical protein
MDAGQENVDKEIKELLHSLEILILFASILIAVSISIPFTSSQQIVPDLIFLISLAFALLFLAYSVKEENAVYFATLSGFILILEVMYDFIVLSAFSGNNAVFYYLSFIPLDLAFLYYFYTRVINITIKLKKHSVLIIGIFGFLALGIAVLSIYILSGLKLAPIINILPPVIFLISFIIPIIYVYKKSHFKNSI